MISLEVTAQRDRAAWFGEEEHVSSAEIVMMHTMISRVFYDAPSNEQKHIELTLEMWSGGTLRYGRLRVPVYS